MSDFVAHTKPFFDQGEADALLAVIKTRLVNEGDLVNKLVRYTAQLANSLGGVPTSSGTLALHLAIKTLGVNTEDDEVVIPDFACRSLYDCIKMAGGTPVFCDINLEDYSLSIDSVRSRLHKNTRAIILPHMYGCPARIDDFLGLEISIVEDCAQTLGAAYRGAPVGSFGALSCFSFEGSKLIAAGEGGVALANNDILLQRLNALRYGLEGHFAYQYRLSNLIAAVAMIQLDKLPFMIERRKHIATIYRNELRDLEDRGILRLPNPSSERESVWCRFVVVGDTDSADLIDFANQKGILIRNPLPSGCLSKTYRDYAADNPNARLLAANGASLPIYPDLGDADIAKVVDVIHSFYKSRRVL
jgi:dTDP-4-amino-4,6-dideoxygalactose transaminase